jgi:hypothetical protein
MPYVEPVKVKLADVATIVRATFPEYKGRRFRVQPAENVSLQDLNWSGGSRSQYRACTLDGQPLGNADAYNMRWPGDNRGVEGSSVTVPPGCVMVRHSFFCGKDMGLTITCHPSNMPALLANPTREA